MSHPDVEPFELLSLTLDLQGSNEGLDDAIVETVPGPEGNECRFSPAALLASRAAA